MGRPPRNSQGGYAYHVLCRGLKPRPIFRSEDDYADFELALRQAVDRFEPKLLSFCVLPKLWHMVVIPRKDGDLSKLMAWLIMTHSARWHTKPKRSDSGGLYERRFKSFPVQDDGSLLEVMRYIESQPVRVGLVERAEQWRWSSVFHRNQKDVHASEDVNEPLVSLPPVAWPTDWGLQINEPLPDEILQRILISIDRSRPYGTASWVDRTTKRLGLESTLRARGRPRNT